MEGQTGGKEGGIDEKIEVEEIQTEKDGRTEVRKFWRKY
jgi:hypothetical protein